jgi:hypothetical protein
MAFVRFSLNLGDRHTYFREEEVPFEYKHVSEQNVLRKVDALPCHLLKDTMMVCIPTY